MAHHWQLMHTTTGAYNQYADHWCLGCGTIRKTAIGMDGYGVLNGPTSITYCAPLAVAGGGDWTEVEPECPSAAKLALAREGRLIAEGEGR